MEHSAVPCRPSVLSIVSISGEAVHSSLAVAIRQRGLSTDHGIYAGMPVTCSTAVSLIIALLCAKMLRARRAW